MAVHQIDVWHRISSNCLPALQQECSDSRRIFGPSSERLFTFTYCMQHVVDVEIEFKIEFKRYIVTMLRAQRIMNPK